MADSQIRRTSVEIEVQCLSANGDRAEVLRIILLRRSSHTAISGSSLDIGRGCGSKLLVCLPEEDWTWGKRLWDAFMNSERLLCAPDWSSRCEGQNGQSRKS